MTDKSQKRAEAPVELWYTRCGAATASGLAIRKQWLQQEFAQAGTVLHSLRDSDSLAIRNSHYHHEQSGMFREGGNIPPIWAKGSGQDTVVIGITWLDEYQGILARASSDIKTVQDLRGKRLGIPLHENAVIDFQRGAAQHGFATALKIAGLNQHDAVFVDLAAPTHDVEDGPRKTGPQSGQSSIELEALEQGLVDAVFIRFARGVNAAKDPRFFEVININKQSDPLLRVNNGTPRPITVDRKFLQQHPQIVARYLAVLLRTARWASENHDEVVRLLAGEGNAAAIEDVLASHGPDVHQSFTPKLSANYIAGLNEQKNFLRDYGYLKHDFDVNDWIVQEPLAQAHELIARDSEHQFLAA